MAGSPSLNGGGAAAAVPPSYSCERCVIIKIFTLNEYSLVCVTYCAFGDKYPQQCSEFLLHQRKARESARPGE